MNKYKYAASTNAFYSTSVEYPNLPDDAQDIGEFSYIEFAANVAPDGKMRIAGPDGFPAWADIPLPAENEVTDRTLVKNTTLRAQHAATAALNIATLQAGIDSNRSVEGDSDALTEWQIYLCDLRDMTSDDLQQSPAVFPVIPASVL